MIESGKLKSGTPESGKPESGIYVGKIRHRRFRPVVREFTYPLFMAFLDVDRIPELMKISRWSSYGRWNWASFREEDHFGDPKLSLRQRLQRDAKLNNVELPDGKIFLLTHLRYLGYNFNPVSYFYCYDRDEKLRAIVAEVNNTFGETHNYWLTAESERAAGSSRRYLFRKAFHVSPFMQLDHDYDWTFTQPGERLITQCNNYEDGSAIFDSTLKLEHRPWSAVELRRTLLQFPWMTAKVIAAIHWQAVRLLLRRVPVVPHPGAGHFQPANTQHVGASWPTN